MVLLFPGQGAQHNRMAEGLYGHDPEFTQTVDTVLAMFSDGDQLRTDWLSDAPSLAIEDVRRAQPLLFTIGYALGRMVLSWGVRPAALLGHSVGELVAATLAGVFTPRAAVDLLSDRVTKLAGTPPGGMLTVSAQESDLASVLVRHPRVSVGAINAPRQIALTGFQAELGAAEEDLRAAGYTVRRVAAGKAFHSPALAGVFAGPYPIDEHIMHSPRIPLWSAFTANRVLTPDPYSWAGHPAEPVLFWPTLEKIMAEGPCLLADLGPGQGLATLARRHPDVRSGRSAVTALLPVRDRDPAVERETGERARQILLACQRHQNPHGRTR